MISVNLIYNNYIIIIFYYIDHLRFVCGGFFLVVVVVVFFSKRVFALREISGHDEKIYFSQHAIISDRRWCEPQTLHLQKSRVLSQEEGVY